MSEDDDTRGGERRSALALAVSDDQCHRRLAQQVLWAALMLVAAIAATSFIVVAVIRDAAADGMVLELRDSGLTVSVAGSRKQYSIVTVPAAACWVDTGIWVDDGTTVNVKATGRVNLAIHRVVSAANYGKEADLYPWNDPEGRVFKVAEPVGDDHREERRDTTRRKFLLLDQNSTTGALIACFVPRQSRSSGAETAFPRTGVRDFAPKLVGKDGAVVNKTGGPAQLWLAVNDIHFESATADEIRTAIGVHCDYGETQAEIASERGNREQAATNVIEQRLYRRYFDDNVGSFSAVCTWFEESGR